METEQSERKRMVDGPIVDEKGQSDKTIGAELERIQENIEATDEAHELADSGDIEDRETPVEKLVLNGRSFKVRQYFGIGDLNFDTGRGELKVRSGDYTIELGEMKGVFPREFVEMLKTTGDDAKPKEEVNADYEDRMNKMVLNNKSGPDKFTYPIEPIGVDRLERPGPPGPLGTVGTVSSAPYGVENPYAQRVAERGRILGPEHSGFEKKITAGDVLGTDRQRRSAGTPYPEGSELSESSGDREKPDTKPVPPNVGGQPNRPGAHPDQGLPGQPKPTPLPVEEIRRKKDRGEKLTGDEQARLIDADMKAKK